MHAGGGIAAQLQREGKAAALPQRAGHGQLAAHQMHQTATDGQAQAGAAKAPRGRGLCLGKTFKNSLQAVSGNANARIAHGKLHAHPLRPGLQELQSHHHLAALGEFDGIARQIQQHLLQAQIIAAQNAGHGRIELKQHLHLFVLQSRGQHHREVAHQLIEAKRCIVKHQLARLHLGEIQNIVEDGQQRARRAFSLVDVVLLARIQTTQLQQLQQAQHGIHGGANFVAHVGYKFTFGLAGRFSLARALGQCCLRRLGQCVCLATAALGQKQAGHRHQHQQRIHAARQRRLAAPAGIHGLHTAPHTNDDGLVHLQRRRLQRVLGLQRIDTRKNRRTAEQGGGLAAGTVAHKQRARLSQIHAQPLLVARGAQKQHAIAMHQRDPHIRGSAHRLQHIRKIGRVQRGGHHPGKLPVGAAHHAHQVHAKHTQRRFERWPQIQRLRMGLALHRLKITTITKILAAQRLVVGRHHIPLGI